MEGRLSCGATTSGRVAAHQAAAGRVRAATRLIARRPAARQLLRAVSAEQEGEKPEWVLEMEEAAADDPAIAELLRGTGGNADVIQARMKAEMDALHARIMSSRHGGEEAAMEVS